jgi:magnesium chelatase subunit D
MNGFPFSAVVGMDELRLGLVLNAVSPGIGGVLVRGEKGTAKSTMVRALAAILPRPIRPAPMARTSRGRVPSPGPRGWSNCRSGPARTGWSARWTSSGR